MLRQLAPVVATSVVVLFLLVSAIPLMHWFQSDSLAASFDEHRALWRASGPDSYRFALDMTCDCDELPEMPLRITVLNGQPVSIENSAGTRLRRSSMLPLSVEEVFRLAQSSIGEQPDVIDIDYDVDYGFPRSIYVDPDANKSGDEQTVLIVAFDPRTATSEDEL